MRATSPRNYAPVCRSNLWLLSFVARVLMCAAELVQIAAMSEQMITFESLTQDARKTQEVPPRVSVYDVIAAAKGCDGNVAGMMFRRMVQAGTVPLQGARRCRTTRSPILICINIKSHALSLLTQTSLLPFVIGTMGPIPFGIGTKCPAPLGTYCASWQASPFAVKSARLFCANQPLGHRTPKILQMNCF